MSVNEHLYDDAHDSAKGEGPASKRRKSRQGKCSKQRALDKHNARITANYSNYLDYKLGLSDTCDSVAYFEKLFAKDTNLTTCHELLLDDDIENLKSFDDMTFDDLIIALNDDRSIIDLKTESLTHTDAVQKPLQPSSLSLVNNQIVDVDMSTNNQEASCSTSAEDFHMGEATDDSRPASPAFDHHFDYAPQSPSLPQELYQHHCEKVTITILPCSTTSQSVPMSPEDKSTTAVLHHTTCFPLTRRLLKVHRYNSKLHQDPNWISTYPTFAMKMFITGSQDQNFGDRGIHLYIHQRQPGFCKKHHRFRSYCYVCKSVNATVIRHFNFP